MFKFSQAALLRFCQIYNIDLPESGILIIGFRGALPVYIEDNQFRQTQALNPKPINHTHLRCTLAQWDIKAGKIALFAGSTVPNKHSIVSARAKGGAGANQMLPGYYKQNGFIKGEHYPSERTKHQAFIQAGPRPVRRSADDLDYDNLDRVEFGVQWDNNHAAWGTDNFFSSAGCQVIAGYPDSQISTASGPWKTYKENLYKLPQYKFPYILAEAFDMQAVASMPDSKLSKLLRFGSTGAEVVFLQECLKKSGNYSGSFDGDFGFNTLKAVMDFQTKHFGSDQDDGIVGPKTAAALGFKLPVI